MEKLKEENETLVFSLRNHIEELKAEIVEKENKIEVWIFNDLLFPESFNALIVTFCKECW